MDGLDRTSCARLAQYICKGIASGRLSPSRGSAFLFRGPSGTYYATVLGYAATGRLGSPEAVIEAVQRYGSWRTACAAELGVSHEVLDLALLAQGSGVPIERVVELLRDSPEQLTPLRVAPLRWQATWTRF